MSNIFQLTIVSPAQKVYEGAVSMVEIPGAEGDFGVLAGHSPILSMLREGTVTVHGADRDQRRFHVTNGYADVSATQVTILSESITAA